MKDYLIYFATIALILPAYFMGLFFIFKYFTIELKDIERKKGIEPEIKKEDIIEEDEILHDKKVIDYLEREVEFLKSLVNKKENEDDSKSDDNNKDDNNDDDNTPNTSSVEQEDKKDSEKEENLLEKDEDEPTKRPERKPSINDTEKLQSFLARMDFVKFRNSLSVENIESKLNVVLTRIVDNFMQSEYYTNKRYINSDGTFNIPMITQQRRERELILLYARFRKLVSEDIMEELSMVYSREELDSESFIISNYIAPLYNDRINKLKRQYRDYQERIAQEEKLSREERLKFENTYDGMINSEAYKIREALLNSDDFVEIMNNIPDNPNPEEIHKQKMKDYYRALLKENNRVFR